MLHGIAGTGVYGMGIAFAVSIIESAIISARSHSAIGEFHHGFNLIVHLRTVVNGTIYAYVPRRILGIFSFCHYLAANFHQIVFNAKLVEKRSYRIASVTFGYCAAIELCFGILLYYSAAIRERNLAVAHCGEQTAYVGGSNTVFFCKTKAPGINKRCNGNVESTVGCFRNGLRQTKNMGEHGVYPHVAIFIDSSDDTPFVERRKRGIDHGKTLVYLGLQVAIVGICYVVISSEHISFIIYVSRVIAADYDSRTRYRKKHEKYYLSFSESSAFHNNRCLSPNKGFDAEQNEYDAPEKLSLEFETLSHKHTDGFTCERKQERTESYDKERHGNR